MTLRLCVRPHKRRRTGCSNSAPKFQGRAKTLRRFSFRLGKPAVSALSGLSSASVGAFPFAQERQPLSLLKCRPPLSQPPARNLGMPHHPHLLHDSSIAPTTTPHPKHLTTTRTQVASPVSTCIHAIDLCTYQLVLLHPSHPRAILRLDRFLALNHILRHPLWPPPPQPPTPTIPTT